MTTTSIHKTAIRTSVILAISTFSGIAGEQEALVDRLPEASTSSPAWHWKANLYGWAESLDGDVTIRGNDVPVDLDFDDILDDLDFAIMGSAEIGYGRWSLIADASYVELSGSSSFQRVSVKSELDQFIGNFALAYEVFGGEKGHLNFYAGARVNSIDADVSFTGRLLGTGISDSKTWVDPIVGIRYQHELSERLFLRLVGDVGGFDVSSDFTWQAMGMLGYRFTDQASVLLGYRGIGTDYSSGDFGYDITSQGAVLGFEYKF